MIAMAYFNNSMTRWLNDWFNIWPFGQLKYSQWHIFSKLSLKSCQILYKQ